MPNLIKLYKDIALILLNTIIVVLVLNVVLGVIYFAYDGYKERQKNKLVATFTEDGAPTDNGKRSNYQLRWFDYNATREVSREHAAEVLDDFYALGQRGFIYQPYVEFSEPQFAGKHVSIDVDEHGFTHRRTVNPPASKPTIDVFTLGGSTTFSYNVADEHTWPSYLSSILNERAGGDFQVRVTNFGRGYYDTSQELALIITLLRTGYRPSLVMFMDGVNIGSAKDEPALTPRISQAVNNVQHGREKVSPGLKEWMRKWIPMVRLALSIKSQSSSVNDEPVAGLKQEDPHQLAERFRQNRRMIKEVCAQYGVETLFFLQPDAVYNYPLQLYRASLPETFLSSRKMRQSFYEEIRKDDDWIYLGNLFEEFGVDQGRKAIVDDVHYSPNFNKFLAERVAGHVDLKKLKEGKGTASK